VKYPYNVNGLSIRTAMEALTSKEQRDAWIGKILRERQRLTDRLESFGFIDRIHPSDANFLLVRTEDPKGIHRFLADRGIIVRDRSSVPLCQGCLRITVGTQDENDRLLEALKTYGQNKLIQEP
jgi:histidinol-phosphate aminotransferase